MMEGTMSAPEKTDSPGCNNGIDTEIIYVIATEEGDVKVLDVTLKEGGSSQEEGVKNNTSDVKSNITGTDLMSIAENLQTVEILPDSVLKNKIYSQNQTVIQNIDAQIDKYSEKVDSKENSQANSSQFSTLHVEAMFETTQNRAKKAGRRQISLVHPILETSPNKSSIRKSKRIVASEVSPMETTECPKKRCKRTVSTNLLKTAEIHNTINVGDSENVTAETSATVFSKDLEEMLTNPLDCVSNEDSKIKNFEQDSSIDEQEHPIILNPEQYSTVNLRDREPMLQDFLNRPKVELFAEDTGPSFYNAKGVLVSQSIITKSLPKVFEPLPLYGKPYPNSTAETFFRDKIREFVGSNLTDTEFSDLESLCSPENLKTGNEIQMRTAVPVMGLLSANTVATDLTEDPDDPDEEPNLCIIKKAKIRVEKDIKGLFLKKLKYRGVRLLTFSQEANPESSLKSQEEDADLDPGTDLIYHVRLYRPYFYNLAKDRHTRTRHSVFSCDALFSGRQRLTALRDRFVCNNDYDMRVDVSNCPDALPNTKARDLFPSGFLFINNTFYVDTREGCVDYAQVICDWALKKKIGTFPKRDMCQYRFQDLVLKLGHPDVYVHQGNCEHVFIFSEVRLLGPTDPLKLSKYPCSSAIAQNQTIYCTTCAEFCAKWIVTGCARVPFDPAFFCDTCFRNYLYEDGKKKGDFKAYPYRGNVIHALKPQ